MIEANRINIKLPAPVNKYLNLDKDYMLKKDRTDILLTDQAFEPDIVIPDVPVTEQTKSIGQILVLCDIAESQLFGHTSLPVLRVFRAAEESRNKLEYVNFSPVMYVNPKDTDVSELKVSLVD